MPYLSEKQRKAFKESYLVNEMDTIFNSTDDNMRQELFQTNDRNDIYNLLEKSIENIETVEDVQDGFGEVYDHIFEGMQENEVTLCGYDNKIYSFDKIKLEEFIGHHYDITLYEFLNDYTYDDTEELKHLVKLRLI